MSELITLPYRIVNLGRLFYDQTGVAPHSETTRVTYTVAANCYAYIPFVNMLAKRATAATTAGTFGAKFQLLLGGTEIVLIGLIFSRSNTVGDHDRLQVPAGIWLRPGDMIRFTTFDTSAGGTIDYSLYCPYYVLF